MTLSDVYEAAAVVLLGAAVAVYCVPAGLAVTGVLFAILSIIGGGE